MGILFDFLLALSFTGFQDCNSESYIHIYMYTYTYIYIYIYHDKRLLKGINVK